MNTIYAVLESAERITVPALDIEINNRMPICTLARKLESMGYGDAILDITQNNKAAFNPTPVSAWAKVSVSEAISTRFTKFVPFKGIDASE